MAAYTRSFMEDEDELEQLEMDRALSTQEPDLNKEEQTWKKRYGDLRRLSQAQDAKIAAMQKQMENASKASFKLPSSDDEAALEEWSSTYPDIARVVRTLANKEADARSRELDEKMKNFEEDKRRNDIVTAQKKLSEAHPDFFDEIRTSPEFEEWILDQPKRMQDALYSDESVTDWKSAANVITLYKVEKGLVDTKPRKQADPRREAVRDVPTRQTTKPSNRGEHAFTESQIKKMAAWEYDQNEEAISKAMREGKVLMDVSGGAR